MITPEVCPSGQAFSHFTGASEDRIEIKGFTLEPILVILYYVAYSNVHELNNQSYSKIQSRNRLH